MEVHIKNNQLPEFINLLFGLKLKSKQSRHRSKFLKILGEQLEARNESEAALRKEHCNLDEAGEPKTIETDRGIMWDIIDEQAFSEDVVELMNETVVVCGPQHEETIRTVGDALFSCEEEFSGMDAATYDTLCELFEKAIESEG